MLVVSPTAPECIQVTQSLVSLLSQGIITKTHVLLSSGGATFCLAVKTYKICE